MPVLHNRVSNEMLKARMLAETEPRTTISFYKYFTIDDPQATRDALYQALWDFADDANDTRTVDLHVQRLRKKLQLADDIVTVFKVGYRMVAR